MSVEITTRVWKHSTAKGSHKLVLLAIADMADMEGEAYPGVARIAEMVGLKTRQVQVVLRDLEAAGELETSFESSKWKTNVYRVTVAERVHHSAPGGCTTVHRGGAPQCTGGVHHSAPKPSLDPSVETPVDPLEVRDVAVAAAGGGKVLKAIGNRPLTEADVERFKARWPGRPVEEDVAYWRGHIGFRTAADKPAFVERKLTERYSSGPVTRGRAALAEVKGAGTSAPAGRRFVV